MQASLQVYFLWVNSPDLSANQSAKAKAGEYAHELYNVWGWEGFT